ncbi:MAG: hypothetical protein JWP88_1558 [Flaviaesturariibacter sp.]|nr:hypothetical protein [Flaviaesturariibacter sp.]
MLQLTRKTLIDALIHHETLTIDDIAKPVNLGLLPDAGELTYLLNDLKREGFITIIGGASPCTYTITDKGISEGRRLNQLAMGKSL